MSTLWSSAVKSSFLCVAREDYGRANLCFSSQPVEFPRRFPICLLYPSHDTRTHYYILLDLTCLENTWKMSFYWKVAARSALASITVHTYAANSINRSIHEPNKLPFLVGRWYLVVKIFLRVLLSSPSLFLSFFFLFSHSLRPFRSRCHFILFLLRRTTMLHMSATAELQQARYSLSINCRL